MYRAVLVLLLPLCGSVPSPKFIPRDGKTNIALCVIDVNQAMFKLGQAGNALNAAISACKRPVFPNTRRAACSATVSDVIASLLDAASFLSLSASDCAESLNLAAYCSADVTGFVAALAGMADAGSAISLTCSHHASHKGAHGSLVDKGSLYDRRLAESKVPAGLLEGRKAGTKPFEADRNSSHAQGPEFVESPPAERTLKGTDQEKQGAEAGHGAPGALAVPERAAPEGHDVPGIADSAQHGILGKPERELRHAGEGGLLEQAALYHEAHELVRERQAELSECFFDAGQAALFLARAGMAINAAVTQCHPFDQFVKGRFARIACTVDLTGAVASFASVAEFISFAVSHCPFRLHMKALCAGDISKLVAMVSQLAAVSASFPLTCTPHLHPSEDPGIIARRLSATNSTSEGGVLV